MSNKTLPKCTAAATTAKRRAAAHPVPVGAARNAMRVRLVGLHLAHYFGVGDFSLPIKGNIFIENDAKGISTCSALLFGAIRSLSDALTQTT